MGRIGKTVELKRLKGVRPARMPKEDFVKVVPLTSLPPCPDYLSGTAQDVWEKTCKDLHEMGWLNEIDLSSLVTYSINQAIVIEFAKKQKEGTLQESDYRKMFNAADKATRIQTLFGLNPSSRSSIGVKMKNKDLETKDPIKMASGL